MPCKDVTLGPFLTSAWNVGQILRLSHLVGRWGRLPHAGIASPHHNRQDNVSEG
jgi:hypothetical protein